ncbi:MAG: DUF1579 family protein [Bacteroidetes bacterium]|nr:DUF1579 family protein [Bacteroidota bacterium]MBL6943807.1 DUF1579 family protein [Bacteroidales bacterium]
MNLIKYQILTLITFLSISAITVAQNADEIIALHIKAHGDTEKWETIKSMEITGRFTAFSVEEDFYAIKTDTGAYYAELHLGQHKVKESFNGTTGWTIDPWQDFVFPRELNSTEINVFEQKAEFFTPFYSYKEKGHKVELLGKQNVDGVDMYVIVLTRPSGKSETWYLDANTYLEYKCESVWTDFAYPAQAETFFDDFRTIDGLVIPFFVERTYYQRDRITQIENIEFNTNINSSLFEMPQSEEIKELTFMVGEWDVKVEAWSERRKRWYTADSTISTINFIATNLLQEKINYEVFFVQSKIINYTYNSATKKYRITVFNGFSSDVEVLEGNFTDSTFIAENTNISYGDSTQKIAFSQITISEIKQNSFVLEIMNSNDKGNTWNPGVKLTYIRKK